MPARCSSSLRAREPVMPKWKMLAARAASARPSLEDVTEVPGGAGAAGGNDGDAGRRRRRRR